MTKKELEMMVAGLEAKVAELEAARKAAIEFYLATREGVLEVNRLAYAGDTKKARKASWELLGRFPGGHEAARRQEAARKAAATTKKEEVDTSDLV